MGEMKTEVHWGPLASTGLPLVSEHPASLFSAPCSSGAIPLDLSLSPWGKSTPSTLYSTPWLRDGPAGTVYLGGPLTDLVHRPTSSHPEPDKLALALEERKKKHCSVQDSP